MHGNRQSITELLDVICRYRSEESQGTCEIAVLPPALFLPQVQQQLSGTDIAFGAQTVSEHPQGAYTGEIAADMLAEQGCRYVLVGHSERRTLFNETSEQVAEKFAAAQERGLVPVLCVGETLEQREQGETFAVVAEQLKAVINRVGLAKLAEGVIAYEPVWAIGTGVTASPQQAQEVHGVIREQLDQFGVQVRILYGGSVKGSNAAELLSQPDIDGGLVGGASLKAIEFIEICRAAEVVASNELSSQRVIK